MIIRRDGPGVRTQVLLLASVGLMIAGTAVASLFIARSRIRQQVRMNLTADLDHSVQTFQDLEETRRQALERENALLADLPSLKALMTTNDARTVEDGAVSFWKTGGNDLFALVDVDGHVLAADANGAGKDALKRDIQAALREKGRQYLASGNRLYEYSVQPLYFGTRATGTLLGYVIGGYAVDERFLVEVGRGAGAQAAFVSGDRVIASTVDMDTRDELRVSREPYATVSMGGERYLATMRNLSSRAGMPLELIVLKSFAEADRAERDINRLVFVASVLAMVAGAVLMMLLARIVTRPLEQLAAGVRAFGEGDKHHPLPTRGTQEVRYLSRVFARMREEIEKTNHALIESERLATIGRMASSVSHDLRHYLASVYANAEFLASPSLPAQERIELYDEIRLAVNGTTDMLDSLLIFSRTGTSLKKSPVLLEAVAERAISLVKGHPDADGVSVSFEHADDAETVVTVDTKQIERALFNLLLNACQSARECVNQRAVTIRVESSPEWASIIITDTGAGVAEDIRDSLFDPFVSQGKQKGTGLGLTLAWSVAREHGGAVKLLSSRSGETRFSFTIARYPQTPVQAMEYAYTKKVV